MSTCEDFWLWERFTTNWKSWRGSLVMFVRWPGILPKIKLTRNHLILIIMPSSKNEISSKLKIWRSISHNVNMNMNLDTFSSSTEVASFYLSGMKYQVSRSLLDQHPKTMLARCASSQWLADPNSDFFLYWNGYVFRHVLNYLRDGEVILPITVSKNAIINELTYYGIDIVESSIQVCQQASVHGDMAINKSIY